MTKEGDKDTSIWGEVKLERDRKKENVEEKRGERERDKNNKNSKVKYYGKNKTKQEM